jgi:hypothetical protein
MLTAWYVFMIVTNTKWSKIPWTEFPCQGKHCLHMNTMSVPGRYGRLSHWTGSQNEQEMCPLVSHYQQLSDVRSLWSEPFIPRNHIRDREHTHSPTTVQFIINNMPLLMEHEENGKRIVRPVNYWRSGPVLHVTFLNLELGPIEMIQITIRTSVH